MHVPAQQEGVVQVLRTGPVQSLGSSACASGTTDLRLYGEQISVNGVAAGLVLNSEGTFGTVANPSLKSIQLTFFSTPRTYEWIAGWLGQFTVRQISTGPTTFSSTVYQAVSNAFAAATGY